MATLNAYLCAARMPRSELLALAELVTGRRREALIAHETAGFTGDDDRRMRMAIDRRLRGEPLAYIVGFREFFGRRFAVDASVLIPRPDTELLVEQALRWIDTRRRASGAGLLTVLELGTGSGAIAITLALESPDVAMVASDRSTAALEVARRNGESLGAGVHWVEADWFDFPEGSHPTTAGFDLIVSNPPYIALGDPHLAIGDLRHEPPDALASGHDGLDALRAIVAGAPGRLRRDGRLMLEHGFDQAASVRALFAAAGYDRVESFRDLAGIERVTVGRPAPDHATAVSRDGPL